MPLLDVNALVALAWDSHVHHSTVRNWFANRGRKGWSTCPVTESGFVRVSSNPKVMPHPVGVQTAIGVLDALRSLDGHSFLADDVSLTNPDTPVLFGHRQVTDAHLLVLARRHDVDLLTFDSGIERLAEGRGVELLRAL